jgi:anti-anti-sigma regulatory factor
MDCQLYTIPERFAFDEDTSLKVFLGANQAAHIEINAANLRKMDSLLMQYLIAANRAWAQRALTFEITNVPSDIADSMTQLGIHEQSLCWKVAA